MACPKFDRHNKKHVIIAVISAVILLIIIIAIIVAILYATGAAGGFSEMEKAGLNKHNEYRKKHHVDNLELSSELNSIAKKCAEHYAKKGTIDHSCPDKKEYKGERLGENLYMAGMSSDPGEVKIAEEGVTMWYNEVKMYNFASGGFSSGTGHFTQLVWKASKELGLGLEVKDGKQFKEFYFVALYKPGGNSGGYKENVLPE